MNMDAEQLIFARRHAVCVDIPAFDNQPGEVPARQLDAVLMPLGFKLSGELIGALAGRPVGYVIDTAVKVIGWARELSGAHVQHNTYFIDFPRNVPDTMDFWADCLMEATREFARTGEATVEGGFTPLGDFVINLLTLPAYGRYQHSFSEMIEHHAELIPLLGDRMTVIHLGRDLTTEAQELYSGLAGSRVPLSGENLDALRFLAGSFYGSHLKNIPVRENRAVINAAALRHGLPLAVGTFTDFVRLAAELAGGDVTLQESTKFRFRRAERRAFMSALDQFAREQTGGSAWGDILPYAEQWKRIAERVKPHEYPLFSDAQVAFAVARGEYPARTLMSRAEEAFANGNVVAAANWLTISPGLLWRNADRLLRTAHPADVARITGFFAATAPSVSGRVLLSVREHLGNRAVRSDMARIFTNRNGRAWVSAETREPLSPDVITRLNHIIDTEIMSRLPDPGNLVIDPAVLGAALPLSGKSAPEGLGVFPRGSIVPVGRYGTLRFFTYWRQAEQRTDFDLSAVFTDEQFGNDTHISYTRLTGVGAVHSGDITDAPAPDGATEFIDIALPELGRQFIIPQVYVFSGEGFDEVDENFFGFMTLQQDQRGNPFEARTVRSKSALFGDGRTAMPLVFYRGEDGAWYAKWLHLFMVGRQGWFGGYRVEENKVTTKLLARSVMEREYLRVRYLTNMLIAKASMYWTADEDWAADPHPGPVTYIGLERPEKLPESSTVITLENLAELIPE